MQLPLFPENTELLSPSWGVKKEADFIYYLHNGSPVYTHHKDDLNTYRYVTGSLIENNHCSASDLSRVLGVSVRNFHRYAKRLREEGTDAFFNPVDNRGKCHKLTPELLEKAQKYLDLGYSQLGTAKLLKVSESAIRYHLRKGALKKSPI